MTTVSDSANSLSFDSKVRGEERREKRNTRERSDGRERASLKFEANQKYCSSSNACTAWGMDSNAWGLWLRSSPLAARRSYATLGVTLAHSFVLRSSVPMDFQAKERLFAVLGSGTCSSDSF